jgi:proteasome lid subunit RPN8/RPN11
MLWIAAKDLKRLVDLAEATYPEEACALLVGRRGVADSYRVTRVEPAANVAPDRGRRFEVDPGLRMGLERELRGGTEQVIGVWHSHPDGLPVPSAWDAGNIHEPRMAWLITAVAGGQALASAAFVPAAANFFGAGAGDAGGAFRAITLRLGEDK